MATLDYAKDLIELFQQNTNEYVLVVIQPGKKKDKALVFYNVSKASSATMLGETLHYVAEERMNVPAEGASNIKTDDEPKKE